MDMSTASTQEESMSRTRYVVIENTPGYMPDEDEPYTTDDYDEAVAYLNDRAAEYDNDESGIYRAEHGFASADNLAAVMIWNDASDHDLGRYIGVEIDHDHDDNDDADEPDQEFDGFVSPGRDGYVATLCSRFLGVFDRESRAWAALYLAMQRDGYYPNLWLVNDHGNVEQMAFDSHVIRATGNGLV